MYIELDLLKEQHLSDESMRKLQAISKSNKCLMYQEIEDLWGKNEQLKVFITQELSLIINSTYIAKKELASFKELAEGTSQEIKELKQKHENHWKLKSMRREKE